MPTNVSARSEQSKQPAVNLASLPREEAMQRARVAGREILGDIHAIQGVSDTLWLNWINVNAPVAIGQTDAEFGELIEAMGEEFSQGLSEGVARFQAVQSDSSVHRTLERAEKLLVQKSHSAWKIYNIIAFMVEALPEDAADALPTRCTLADVRGDIEELATSLMDLIRGARHG